MKHIQEAVRGWLELATGVKTVSDRTRAQGEYPLLAVSVREDGTVLMDGGRQAEHTYQVTVTAAADREREGNVSLLSQIVPVLLRGIPMELPTEGPAQPRQSGFGGESLHGGGASAGCEGSGACEKRVLHPLGIATEDGELTFSLTLCVPVPRLPKPGETEPGIMERLHLGVESSGNRDDPSEKHRKPA